MSDDTELTDTSTDEPVVDEATVDEQSAAAPPPDEERRRLRLIIGCAAVFCAALLLVTLFTVVKGAHISSDKSDRENAAQVAGEFTSAYLGYDYRDIHHSLGRALRLTTSQF